MVSYDKLLFMNKPLSCGAQDMLEAAIVQRRRINLTTSTLQAGQTRYTKVLPIDIGSQTGEELLTIMTTDNQGGIIKLTIKTQEIIAFEADDFKDPRILYQHPINND